MNITLDGSIKSVDFNGTDVDKVTFNGTVVWEKPSPEPQIVLKLLNNSNWDPSWETLEDLFEDLGIITYTQEEMSSKTLEPADAARWVLCAISETDRAKIASYKATGVYSYVLTGSFSEIYNQITKNKDFWYFAYE